MKFFNKRKDFHECRMEHPLRRTMDDNTIDRQAAHEAGYRAAERGFCIPPFIAGTQLHAAWLRGNRSY